MGGVAGGGFAGTFGLISEIYFFEVLEVGIVDQKVFAKFVYGLVIS